MYAYIDGKLTFKCPAYVVIEAAGVGYHIHISLNTYSALKDQERCKLFTWLSVKEDSEGGLTFFKKSIKTSFNSNSFSI